MKGKGKKEWRKGREKGKRERLGECHCQVLSIEEAAGGYKKRFDC
jgi:hypothetical protein